MSRSIKTDQVADVFTSVPGVSTLLLLDNPSSTETVNSGTWEDINANLTDVSANVPVTGLYMLQLRIGGIFADTGSEVRFRILVDSSPVTSDGGQWETSVATVRETVRFQEPIELTAGSHSLTIQWKRSSGTGTMEVRTFTVFELRATMISGSGAGGTLVTSVLKTGTNQTIPINTPTKIDGLDLVFVVAANEYAEVHYEVHGSNSSATINSRNLLYRVDGGSWICVDTATSAYNVSHSGTLRLALAAGTHLLEWGYYCNTNSTDIRGDGATLGYAVNSRVWVVVHRGGLVPWERDGYAVLDTPRAINIIGGAMSVADDGTGKLNIELPEAVTATGDVIILSDGVPSSNLLVNSSSDHQIMPESGSLSFEALMAGLYTIQFSGELIAPGSNSSGQIKLVFDEGEANEQVIGYNEQWQTRPTTGNYTEPVFRDTVTLTAGSHTVKAYGKLLSGGGWQVGNAVDHPPVLMLQAVTGSGAGGVLLDEAEKTANQSLTVNGTVTLLSELSLSVEATTSEKVEIGWSIPTYKNISTPMVRALYYRIDGGSWIWIDHVSTEYEYTLSGSAVLTLEAGSHTIDFGGATNQQPLDFLGGDSEWLSGWGFYPKCKTWVMQYRGGLVPVRKDGETIVDKPIAFDFTGPGCQVQNIGGAAKISLAGAEGIETVETTDTSVRTGSGTTPTEITQLQTPFITEFDNEIVLATFNAVGYPTTGTETNRVYYQLDSEGWIGMSMSGDTTNYPKNYNWTVPIQINTAGSHTLKIAVANTDGGGWAINGTLLTTRVTVSRFKGGYVHPENVPILEYNSASIVNVKSGPGASSELRVLLNDGKRYTATSPLTVDLSASGLGGLDTGSEASSTWYFAYLVPSATAGTLDAVASVTDPDSGGPTGYDVWRWIGAVYNNSSSNIRKFWQVGDWFYSDPSGTDVTILNTTSPTLGSWVSLSTPLAVAIPVSVADTVKVRGFLDGDLGQQQILWVEPGTSLAWTPTALVEGRCAALLNVQDNSNDCAGRDIELFDGTLSYYCLQPGGSGSIDVGLKATAWRSTRLFGKEALAATSSGWETVLDLDFSTEPNQTLSSDTTYVIGGKTWTKINSANDAVAMAVVNGTGLVIQPASTSDHYVSTRTLPAITVPLESLIAGIDASTRFRVTMYVSAGNWAANYHFTELCLENPTTNTWYAIRRQYNGAQTVAGIQLYNNASQGDKYNNNLSANDVFQIEVSTGLASMNGYWMIGQWSSGWPKQKDMRPWIYRGETGAVMYELYSGATPIVDKPSAWNLLLGAARAGSGTSLSTTIARVKIEVKR